MVEMRRLNKNHPFYQEDLQRIINTPGIENITGKSFLITGATGLLGVCLIDALMLFNKKGGNVTVYAVGRSKEKASERLGEYFANEYFHFIEQDVRYPLPGSIKVDYIMPLASNTHPLAYSQYPIETIEINIKGAEHALNKAVQCGATVLYPSSVEIYGNARNEDVFTENYTGALNLSTARSCYTESKRVCEALCQSYIAEKSINVKIARLSRVFGPTMLMSDSKASSQFLIKALSGENIVLKSKGEQFFSFTYVAEVVSAMLFVLWHGITGVAYNISNERCNVHLKDFAQFCAKTVGCEVVFEIPSDTEKKGFSIATQAVMDNTRLLELGWTQYYSFGDAIRRTIEILK